MQKLALTILGAASLFALPALAQTTPSTNSTQNNSSQSDSSSSNQQQVRQKIAQNLRSDGYQDVKVIPNSFLVHAKNKHGQPVVMIINPDSVFAVTQMSNSQGASANPNGTSGNQSGVGNSPSNSTTKK